jgi:3'(2'), 5'-bisphosphate nucleotidase
LEGESVLGVVYQPTTGVLYRAARGRGALVERPNRPPEKGQVSDKTDPKEMGLAVSRTHRGALLERVIRDFGFKEEVRRSSVGIKVGLIVEQRCDLYIHLSPETKQWDTCAPDAILREAGGRLTDLFGRPLRYNLPRVQNTNGIVATNGAAHTIVIEKLAPLLREFGRAPT